MKPSFKSIDLFKRLPKDLAEGTYSGAILSICCLFVMIALVMYEVSTFFNGKIGTVLKIEQIDPNNKLIINMDIDFPACPCDVISVDIQDEMGSHIVDAGDTLKKIRQDYQQGYTDIVMSATNAKVDDPIRRAQIAFDNKEGCSLRGYISVNRVPGNFHVGGHAYKEILHVLRKNINLTHSINHLSFGRKADIARIQTKFSGAYGELTPLNGHSELSEQIGKTTNYRLEIVPTTYRDRIGFKYHVNQYTYAVGSEYVGNEVVYFRYGIIGFTVDYFQTSDSFLQFIISIITVIGGVFTVAGLIAILLNKSLNILYKENIGKKD